MKSLIYIVLGVLFNFHCIAQKTTFDKHLENAIFEKRINNVQILKSTYELKNQLIDDSLKLLITDLLGHHKEFISVDFISENKVVVEYQSIINDENVFKFINRRGRIFSRVKEDIKNDLLIKE